MVGSAHPTPLCYYTLDSNKSGSLKEGTMTRKISLGLSLGTLGLLLGLLISTPPGGSERSA